MAQIRLSSSLPMEFRSGTPVSLEGADAHGHIWCYRGQLVGHHLERLMIVLAPAQTAPPLEPGRTLLLSHAEGHGTLLVEVTKSDEAPPRLMVRVHESDRLYRAWRHRH